jgi:hypothetical protein
MIMIICVVSYTIDPRLSFLYDAGRATRFDYETSIIGYVYLCVKR